MGTFGREARRRARRHAGQNLANRWRVRQVVGHVVHQIRARRSRKAFAITETELKLIAAAAIIGLRSTPKSGKSTPAATGTPRAL